MVTFAHTRMGIGFCTPLRFVRASAILPSESARTLPKCRAFVLFAETPAHHEQPCRGVFAYLSGVRIQTHWLSGEDATPVVELPFRLGTHSAPDAI